jgi:hypothetical protein
MMNYYGGYHGYNYGYGPMTGSFYWPFVMGAMVVGGILFLVWLALVIWALIDVLKHKPAHMTAWIFVILLGRVMGPVGYYFIVAKDRQKK